MGWLMSKEIENPMAKPLTEKEELSFISDDDIKNLPLCEWCDMPVLSPIRRGRSRINMHPDCWKAGKAEYDSGE